MTASDQQPTAASQTEIERFKSFNPATGGLIGVYPVHTDVDVAHAVFVAKAAAHYWWELGWGGRRRALLRWARHIAKRQDELASLVHAENGKPVHDASAEIFLALEHIRWAANHAERVLGGEKVSSGLLMFNHTSILEYRPYGVVGVIGPWNYPIYTPLGSVTYALAAGNAVVFKPSEFTPAIGTWLVEAFHEANPDLPKGVLTVVTGFGETGAALCTSAVDKLAFTGSTATGRKVMAACAPRLTPVVMECGGKDVMIVADDADVPAAARTAVWAGLMNSGQTCVGMELVYVVEELHETFLDEVRKQCAGRRPGTEDDATYGPMTMPAQVEVVRNHVADALARGARAVVGGLESIGDRFIEPIVLTDVPDDCPAVREETFGPTIVVRRVRDVDEAVALVNAADHALGSSVFSRKRGLEIARRLNTGMTAVNAALTFGGVPELPLGGNGASGFGRLHGACGLREFASPKAITERRFTVPFAEVMSFDTNPVLRTGVRVLVRLRHGLMPR